MVESEGPVLRSISRESDDMRIIRALLVSPRAGFASIAHALRMTEPTVARRYRQLVAGGVLRVVGVVDTGALGQRQWMVRVRCRPGAAPAIADELAQHADIVWVTVSAGGSEVTCAVLSWSSSRAEELLGERIPRRNTVTDLQPALLLHQFVGRRAHYWAALAGVRTAEEEALLGDGSAPFTEGRISRLDPVRLDEHDRALLAALSIDGRASLVDLAAATGLTPGRAARRMERLSAEGVLHIDVDLAAMALGYRARADLWMRVHPSQATDAGRALARMPEIVFAAANAGRNNLHAVAHCSTVDELFRFTSGDLGGLPGVTALEVSPVSAQIKQAGTLVHGERLVPFAPPT